MGWLMISICTGRFSGEMCDAASLALTLRSFCIRFFVVLFHAQLDDPFNEVVGNRFVKWKLKIALRTSVLGDGPFDRWIARNGRVQTDVLLPRCEVDKYPVPL